MTTTEQPLTSNIEDLRAQLASAEAQTEKQRRATAAARVRELRAEGRKLEKRYNHLHGVVVRGEGEAQRLRNGELRQAWAEYRGWAAPLPPLAFATEPEIAERAKQAGLWKARHEELLEQIRKVETSVGDARLEALRIVQHSLPSLRSELQNQGNIAAGRRPGEIVETGLSRVESFL